MTVRRRAILVAGAATAAASSSPKRAAARPRKPDPATFVLVHGAWHGGWCWREVAAQLERQGHRVLAPTLTGLGERRHLLTPDTGLSTHIADVLAVLEYEELQGVVLCGHSYGGMVISGVCDAAKARIRHAVFLDAAVPRDGQSMATQGSASPDAVAQQRAAFEQMAAGGLAVPAFDDLTIFGVPADHPRAPWLKRRLTPHPIRTWFEPVRLPNGGSQGLPRTYAHCVRPAMAGASFPAHARRIRSDPTWRYAELQTGHDAMVTAPEAVVALLLDAAA